MSAVHANKDKKDTKSHEKGLKTDTPQAQYSVPFDVNSANITELQRMIGNRGVQHLLAQRKPHSNMIQREGEEITAWMGGANYMVVAGDTLWDIAQRTYGDGHYWREIYTANPDKVGNNGNLILIGTQLNLPSIEVPVASGVSQQPSTPEASSTASSTSSPSTSSSQTSTDQTTSSQPTPEAPSTTSSTSSPSTTSSQTSTNQTTSSTPDLNPSSPARSCLFPAFRWNLDNIPVEIAPMPVPGGILIFSLSLRGNITFQKSGSCLPWSIDQTGLRVEANQAVDEFTTGMRINSIGSGQMSLGTTWGPEFVSNEFRYVPPSTMVYIAQTRNMEPIVLGDYMCNLNLGYEMRVTYVPLPNQTASEPVAVPTPEISEGQPAWLTALEVAGGIVLIVGAAALVAGTLAEDVATGGAGIVDDPISFATAAGMFQQGAAMAF